ncbi:MAG: LamG-like jellyroll fold domain-containing protein, partial [Chitinophagales bacterium]
MSYKNKISGYGLLIVSVLAFSTCKKLERPALGDYAKDSSPPGGPLKFYASFDATKAGNVFDSIRANFGTLNSASLVAGGVSGGANDSALQITSNGYVKFPSANDFGSFTSFTMAFWLKVTLAQKDHNNADGILAFASSNNFWSNAVVFADHESSTSDSMQLKFHFANGPGDNWDFAGYTGSARWPGMYDGNWHHVAFVYDAPSKTATLYRDGVQFDQKTNEIIAFDNAPSSLIVDGFQEAAGIVDNYADNS